MCYENKISDKVVITWLVNWYSNVLPLAVNAHPDYRLSL